MRCTFAGFGPLFLCLTVAALVAGCGRDIADDRRIALTECRLPRLSTSAQCGELEVPENRERPDGRKIRIFAAVLPANTVSPKEDPLVILAGGPGQAASQLASFAARLTDVRRTRDVVLIDQRGTGRSSALDCAALRPRDDDEFETDPLPRARECLAQLESQGVDLTQYTTAAWIADLEAMRDALGYRRWNLWGGSYGSRVAQEYLRRHPERVRTMTLDGVVPPSMIVTLDVWRNRATMLRALFATCHASTSCRAAHPDLEATLSRIAADLGPAGREVAVTDPHTGRQRRLRITFDIVLAALQPLAYAPETAVLLPEMLALAADGEYAPLFAASPTSSNDPAEQLINAALHFSVTCAEDVPRIPGSGATPALAGLRTQRLAQQAIAVCNIWPKGTAPADAAQALTSDLPVLLLSGGMDPVTPPAYGDAVAKGFPNSRHIVAPGYGHIVSAHACAPRLIAAFVEQAGFGKLPASCIAFLEKSAPPPMWPDRLAPQP